ncbi:MAG: hypothetical protein WC247_10400 [Porticoccaceae bacterium]
MKAHLIHGFNVSDGGSDSIGKLAPFFALEGIDVIDHNYGWVGLLRLRWRNRKATRRILPHIAPGDILVGHSNGCLVCWELLEAGAPAGAVICIQPALRRDCPWPTHVPVLCLYNPADWIVSLGRLWGRFISVANPISRRHGWGAAGRHGFDPAPNITNWNTDTPPVPARGHAGLFHTRPLLHWGPRIHHWAITTTGTRT